MPSNLEIITATRRRPIPFRCPICFKNFDGHKALYDHHYVHLVLKRDELPKKYASMSKAAKRRRLRENLMRWEEAIHGVHFKDSKVRC